MHASDDIKQTGETIACLDTAIGMVVQRFEEVDEFIWNTIQFEDFP